MIDKSFTYEFIDPDQQIASDDFRFVESFLRATGRSQIGWHYITDLTWLYSKVKNWPRNYSILDAGGGVGGPLQFLLAELGFSVTNIDMVIEFPIPAYIIRYGMTCEKLPSFIATAYAGHISPSNKLKKWVKGSGLYGVVKSYGFMERHDAWRRLAGLVSLPVGKLRWVRGNLCDMPEFASGSFDAIVSLSAFEHIPIEILNKALGEIRRVARPDARWAFTTSGTDKETTWFHEPSQGYCFSEHDLAKYFNATIRKGEFPAVVIEKYRKCDYLKDNLADYYKKSGKFGMPWGIWDPQYIPVGVESV